MAGTGPASGMAASEEWLKKTVARGTSRPPPPPRGHSPQVLRRLHPAAARPSLTIVALLQQGSEHTAHLQAQLTTVFEAIAHVLTDNPACRLRLPPEQAGLPMSGAQKRGWTADEFQAAGQRQLTQPWRMAASWCMISSRPSSPLPTRKHRSAYSTNLLRPTLRSGIRRAASTGRASLPSSSPHDFPSGLSGCHPPAREAQPRRL